MAEPLPETASVIRAAGMKTWTTFPKRTSLPTVFPEPSARTRTARMIESLPEMVLAAMKTPGTAILLIKGAKIHRNRGTAMRSEQEVAQAIEQYADTVRRICVLHLKNETDTEDVFQTVFLKYLTDKTVFESKAHEKAWIIRVTVNACKDFLKNFFHSHTVSLEQVKEFAANANEKDLDVLGAVLTLPSKYKDMSSICIFTNSTQPLKSANF